MRAIILAAGQGTRLRPLTNDRPKCLVEIRGKTLLDCQLDSLRAAGVRDIHVIAGYRAELVSRPGLTTHINPRYAETNMVSTLFSARDILDHAGDLVISYGDIVYEPAVVEKLVACSAPLCLIVDRQWRRYWSARMENPLNDAETLKLSPDGYVIELGKKPASYADIQGQYIGLIKVGADTVGRLISTWDSMDRHASYDGKTFDTMFMTSFLQYLIDLGWQVKAVPIDNGWLEVDSLDDLRINTDDFVSSAVFDA